MLTFLKTGLDKSLFGTSEELEWPADPFSFHNQLSSFSKCSRCLTAGKHHLTPRQVNTGDCSLLSRDSRYVKHLIKKLCHSFAHPQTFHILFFTKKTSFNVFIHVTVWIAKTTKIFFLAKWMVVLFFHTIKRHIPSKSFCERILNTLF